MEQIKAPSEQIKAPSEQIKAPSEQTKAPSEQIKIAHSLRKLINRKLKTQDCLILNNILNDKKVLIYTKKAVLTDRTLYKTLVKESPGGLDAILDDDETCIKELLKDMLGIKDTSYVQLAKKIIIPWASTSFFKATALSLKQIVRNIALIATRILLIPFKLYNGEETFEPILIGIGALFLESLNLIKILLYGFIPGIGVIAHLFATNKGEKLATNEGEKKTVE